MTELETWQWRELPILQAAVAWFDELGAGTMQFEDVAAATGLALVDVHRGVQRLSLADPSYIFGSETAEARYPLDLIGVQERALVAVGAWPDAESLADRIIRAMGKAAEAEPDQERSSRIRQTATFFATAGRDLLVEVAGSAISKGAGF